MKRKAKGGCHRPLDQFWLLTGVCNECPLPARTIMPVLLVSPRHVTDTTALALPQPWRQARAVSRFCGWGNPGMEQREG